MQSFLYLLLKGSLNLLIRKGLFLGQHENILGLSLSLYLDVILHYGY